MVCAWHLALRGPQSSRNLNWRKFGTSAIIPAAFQGFSVPQGALLNAQIGAVSLLRSE
jgi:hypothetical protein